jgi:hypothetical protein
MGRQKDERQLGLCLLPIGFVPTLLSDFTRMRKAAPIILLGVGVLGAFLAWHASAQPISPDPARKLQSIIIPDPKLERTPKEIVAQLNELAKKYDVPTHQGLAIRFDAAVNSECCGLSVFRGGEPLINWLRDVCNSCGSTYRIDGTNVVIELLPISEKQTPNLEFRLTNGVVELSRQFREKRGQDRFELAQKIFRLLPHSPVTSSKDIGTGTIVTHDYRNPDYKLYKKDVLLLLGKPDRNVNNESFCYALHPASGGFAELSVEFGKYDYAINPGLHWK